MPAFYLIASPIGNLEDLSFRALRILKWVNTIFCEDTRVSMKLLNHYEISGKRLISCNDENEASRVKLLRELLDAGEDIALLSDAGTPSISDPGYKLVAALSGQYTVVPIPGASALTTALSVCPIDTQRFVFEGFLPHGPKQRRRVLRNIAEERAAGFSRPIVFFESPHRLMKTLVDIENIFGGETEIFIARELTKKFEQFYHGTVTQVRKQLAEQFPEDIQGELVLVLARFSLGTDTS